jgi:gamma-glutamyltranspeptidase
VPGTVAEWDLALQRYGNWSLRRVMQPAIRVAREGSSSIRRFSRKPNRTSTSSTTSRRLRPSL